MFARSAIALAVLVLATAGPSYAQPLGTTSIPSSLADDEKRLMPKVMNEFYGSFDKEKHPFSFDKEEKGCWISTKSGPPPPPGQSMWGVDTENTVNVDTTYCMKPIRLDVIKSNGRKMLFVVAGGNYLDEDGQPQGADPSLGVLGLIVLTPRGVNLGVVATTLYEGYEPYGGYPQHDTVTVHMLGPNGTYGWVAKLAYAHSGQEYERVQVYGVVGNSVKFLTGFVTHFSADYGDGEETSLSKIRVRYSFIRKPFLSPHIAGFGHSEGSPFPWQLPLGLR